MTPRSAERLAVDGPAGPLEVVVNAPSGSPRGVALVCHPHSLQGGTLDNKVVQTLAKAFFALGYVATRFNFRGVGQSAGTFDEGQNRYTNLVETSIHVPNPRKKVTIDNSPEVIDK